MANMKLNDVHHEVPELTPVGTWVLTRLMIGGAALLTFTAFAILLVS